MLEAENVRHFRAAPAIDRLIVVSHHAQIAMPAGQRLHDAILAAVGVLIFVDQQVIERSASARRTSANVCEQFFGAQQQIVEIDRAGLLERLLIAAIGHRGQMFFVGRGQASCLLWPNRLRSSSG